jgi:hypothetical protein
MTSRLRNITRFILGLCMAGTAALVPTILPASQGTCTAACARCGACGLTALPLILWLVEKRWRLIAKIRTRFAPRSCARSFDALTDTTGGKAE